MRMTVYWRTFAAEPLILLIPQTHVMQGQPRAARVCAQLFALYALSYGSALSARRPLHLVAEPTERLRPALCEAERLAAAILALWV
jgi:hypothetical protein